PDDPLRAGDALGGDGAPADLGDRVVARVAADRARRRRSRWRSGVAVAAAVAVLGVAGVAVAARVFREPALADPVEVPGDVRRDP
ncbi:MAG TPA: hypothetical protein VD813_16395, partial [Pseudonocardia sp.]|nr:hypothetical protein [Pseudonocardia sp.]